MRALGSDALAKLWEIIKATFAAKTHEHDAADVTSGTLPLARGGTGAALSKTNNAIVRFSGSSNQFSKTATADGAMYATATNGAPKFGTLPIAQGGTGATDAATALANIGAAAANHTHEGHATQSWVNAQIPTKVSAFENDASYASTDWVNNKGYALAADIATTKYNSTSSGSATYFKIADFGSWGTGAWYQKGFSMLIGSRAGETVWLAVSSDDSNTNAKAFRIMNTYSKIAAVYYNVSESSVYVKANAWCNNVTAHIVSNIGGDYVPSVTVVSAVPSGSVEVNIVEFGPTSSSLAVGDSSIALALGGSATRPTYNGAEVALLSDVSTGGSVSIPARLASYQDHTIAVADPNNAVETGFYYINTATNRPPFSQSTNVDYRVLTTAYSDQWLQQIATDFRCADMFIRRRENGTWTSWVRMVSESGGRFTGSISFQDSSLPSKSLQYVCGIDGFAAGGQMGWQSKGDFLAGYATNDSVAAVYEALNGYASKTMANTYNGEQKFQNSDYCPTVTDTASGVGCAFKASRGLANELLADKLIMTASTGKLPIYSYSGTSIGQMSSLTERANFPSTGGFNVYGGRARNGGDDEGIVVSRASNNYAGLCLGEPSGVRSVFYLMPDNSAVWRWNNGTGYDIKHPGKAGTVALAPDSLYSNSSGTTGTVTLSATAADYSILEIVYTDGSRTMSQRVYSPNGKTTILQRSVFSSTSAFYDGSAIITISGTSITWSNQGRLVIGTGSNQTVEADTSTMKIAYVLGWK